MNRLVKLFFVLLLCLLAAGSSHAQSCTTTANVGFQVPVTGATSGWASCIITDFATLDVLLGGTSTLAAGTATPSVSGATNWITANTGTQAITNFTSGFSGQSITLFCGASDTFTSLSSGTNIAVGASFTCASGSTITLKLNGSVWTEIGRSPSGGGGSATAAGGLWWGYSVLSPPVTTNAVSFSDNANNQPDVFAFYLPFSASVKYVTFYVSGGAASSHGDIGMYNSSGTLLWHTGSFSTVSTGVQTITITPVTVSPGLIYFASCDDTHAGTSAYGVGGLGANMGNFFGATNPAHSWGFDSTDTCTAGVLPGTITPSNITNSTSTTGGPIQVRLGN